MKRKKEKNKKVSIAERENDRHSERGTSQDNDIAGPSALEGRRKSKESRSLRFQLPVASIESFSSAYSHTSIVYEDSYEDVHEISVLGNFVAPAIVHNQPRRVPKKSCVNDDADLSHSSSQQLFEIARFSPSPSDWNLHLIKATYLRKLDAVMEAIHNGADVNTHTSKETPLLIATEIGDTRLVAYLLTVPKVNPDFKNYFGQTALIVAVRNAFDQIVQLLLSHNADVNLSDHMGKTPLHGAVILQRKKLMKLLLSYGANVEKEDCFGERPLYTAAVKKPSLECLVTLLKMGASVNFLNLSGTPLLSRTIMNTTSESVVKALVQFGASVNAPDLTSKKTPLHFAALVNKPTIIKYLVRHGADMNLKTTYNFTAYDEAIFQNCTEAAACLNALKNSFPNPSNASLL